MSFSVIHQCLCPKCLTTGDHPDKKYHEQINMLLGRLDEQQRRWFVALEANRIGHGGVRLLSQITGLDEKTIHRGQKELEEELVNRPTRQIRLPGGGRPCFEKKGL